ncbi:transcriptional repressor [uncultured Paludibaculum sp.]|uniref:transcriptional repressor n=1 Tax=uncultured Paludibaculum sp. TaxID=1765020 RepID=UPI002AAB35B3|nr:transcriptional repressor [uncultured Paludibaculum sp.]
MEPIQYRPACDAKASPREDRIHLACLACGRTEEFASPLFAVLKVEIARQSGYDVHAVRLEVSGHCRACRMRPSATQH